ncbi:MAG TPA: histidinol-phosphatase [Actinomycetota bacterium]
MNPNLNFALELADLADKLTMERFRADDLVVETKPDMTPVTEADRAVEQALRHRIAEEYPTHAVVGEEFGAEPGNEAGNGAGNGAGDGAPRWILDPIDGTKNYVRGIPVFATLIALECDGVGQLGVVSAPALGRRWWASRGQGAYADGRRMRVSRVAELGDAQLCHSTFDEWEAVGLGERFLDLLRACWRERGFGDFWIHMLVAEGAAEIAAEPTVAHWDVAPIQVIVEEAGGRFTDLGGTPRADTGSAVSTNGLLHDQVLEALRP